MVEFCYDDDWWLMIDECWYCFSSPSSSCSSFCHIIILYTVYDDRPHSINQSIHTAPHPSHRSCVTWILFWLMICKVLLIFPFKKKENNISLLFCRKYNNSRDAHAYQPTTVILRFLRTVDNYYYNGMLESWTSTFF